MTKTVAEIANSIADDIERMGHFQEPEGTYEPDLLYDAEFNPDGMCCVLRNPTADAERRGWWGDRGFNSPWFEYTTRLRERVIAMGFEDGIVRWSDETPTETVVATLRSLE